MDWIGDPRGTAFMAMIGLALLVLVAVSYARAMREERHKGEFQASEPETTPEYRIQPEDVGNDGEPPSAL